jgi:hypothetical protein
VREDLGQRLDAERLGVLGAHHHDGGRPVRELGGVARGDGPGRGECRRQLRQGLGGGLREDALVAHDHGDLVIRSQTASTTAARTRRQRAGAARPREHLAYGLVTVNARTFGTSRIPSISREGKIWRGLGTMVESQERARFVILQVRIPAYSRDDQHML